MRRISLSVLGVMVLSTIFATAFFLGSRQGKEAPRASVSTSIDRMKAKPSPTQERSPSSLETTVREEYPEEEDKVGFGLEDLIAKTRQHESRAKERKKPAGSRPLLVLIIDDISSHRQLEWIEKLPYHITPSIFPPSRMNRHTPQLAKGLKHYMIHLPMESSSVKMNRFTDTLMVVDDGKKIARRIGEIRRLFPTARFVNNHTGSVFTSNYRAMRRAYLEMKRRGFVFVDSRTSAKSVVRKIAKIYKDPYIGRDVFIDNVQRRSAILKQLRRAVRIAGKRGYAIAIGHPHRATMDALHHAGKILSQVRVVYIDEFYRKHYGLH